MNISSGSGSMRYQLRIGSLNFARSRSWWYVVIVFAVWVLNPEIRRLVDWRSGFNSVSVISIVPMLILVPSVFHFNSTLRSAPKALLLIFWLWLGAFGYGFALSIASGNVLPGAFSLAGFLLPTFFGAFLYSREWSSEELYKLISGATLQLATPVAAYAIYQFLLPPPWDVAWVLSANIDSIGSPVPLGLRAWGTLNAPGPFADFLAAVLILNFPNLDLKRRLPIAQFAIIIVALLLSEVRSAWVALMIGLLTYVLLSPARARNLSYLGGAAIAVFLIVSNISVILGTAQVGNIVNTRLASFTDLSQDASFKNRETYFGSSLQDAIDQPIGEGLGLLGTAAKLGDAGKTADFDNGYLARFTELGYFGFICYLSAIILALVVTVRAYIRARRDPDDKDSHRMASIIGVQMFLLFLDASSDHHISFNGIFFWATLAMAITYRPVENKQRRVN